MECDMHLHVERRKVTGHWEYVPVGLNDEYGYAAFAELVVVMNLTPLAERRGLPQNRTLREPHNPGQITYLTHCARYYPGPGPDERITSWLTLAELEQFDWEAFSREFAETDFSVTTMQRLRELAAGHPEDIRIVFWFDDKYKSQKPQPLAATAP